MSHFKAPQDPADDPLATWWRSPRGRLLVGAERELLRDALDDVFGWELLQVGAWGPERDLLGAARTRHCTVAASLAHVRAGVHADVVTRGTQLPFASDSVEAVLLPHTLEFAADPYALIREVDRILTGEGQLLVLGFRPMSLWGLRSVASRGAFPPGVQRLLSERRLREWLALLGYELSPVRRFLFGLPWGKSSNPTRALRRGFTSGWPAGAYLLRARKRLCAGTPMRLRWKDRERVHVLAGLARPTTRNPSKDNFGG
jgi:SAM-dependent methyltransferase